ncbi:MAG: hypothetical protein J6A92_01115 [Lachnospiraceae bacterium]|nr:hypothetical protein [Lachnospiraceae bacterium]
MNTKPLPAILALVAGFLTCIMSFVQNVDLVIFAKRFIVVCIVFFVIGMVIRIVIDMNFKEKNEEEVSEDLQMEETETEENEEIEEADEGDTD